MVERNRQLIELGAYKPGVSGELDQAVRLMPRIRAFFSQGLDEHVGRDESLAQLRRLAQGMEAAA